MCDALKFKFKLKKISFNGKKYLKLLKFCLVKLSVYQYILKTSYVKFFKTNIKIFFLNLFKLLLIKFSYKEYFKLLKTLGLKFCLLHLKFPWNFFLWLFIFKIGKKCTLNCEFDFLLKRKKKFLTYQIIWPIEYSLPIKAEKGEKKKKNRKGNNSKNCKWMIMSTYPKRNSVVGILGWWDGIEAVYNTLH